MVRRGTHTSSKSIPIHNTQSTRHDVATRANQVPMRKVIVWQFSWLRRRLKTFAPFSGSKAGGDAYHHLAHMRFLTSPLLLRHLSWHKGAKRVGRIAPDWMFLSLLKTASFIPSVWRQGGQGHQKLGGWKSENFETVSIGCLYWDHAGIMDWGDNLRRLEYSDVFHAWED